MILLIADTVGILALWNKAWLFSFVLVMLGFLLRYRTAWACRRAERH
ncbi:hypothetical protein [Nonomuraea phyllanthi]|nr:hypothetical protein [Nonomuraea phyllanthi]